MQELVTKDIKDDLAECQRSINALGRELSDLRDFCEGKIEMVEQRLTNGVLDVDTKVKHQQDVLERMRQIQESTRRDGWERREAPRGGREPQTQPRRARHASHHAAK